MDSGNVELPVSAIVFREDLYPRLGGDPSTAQKYEQSLDSLPPIEVNQHNELIDGWHRWTAHRQVKAETIKVVVTETKSDAQLLELAIDRNAKHGLQLSLADKKAMALMLYSATDESNRKAKKVELIKLLAIGKSKLSEWLSDIDKAAREEREAKIRALYMSCHNQQDIADSVGLTSQGVGQILKEIPSVEKLSKHERLDAEHATDFEPKLYNVWTKAKKSNAVSHFGNTEVEWVDQLLYRYTEPFEVVVDPFAGGGSTIDVCLKRSRRYWVADRAPIAAREKQIRKHDIIVDGIPTKQDGVPWQDVSLVYLDPPYWKQAAGQYSDDESDLGNIDSADEFHKAMADIVKGFAAKMRGGSHIAMIIQPTQWLAPNKVPIFHAHEIAKLVKRRLVHWISAPYATQQYNAQQIQWAKENRDFLVLTREIIVWQV